MAISVVNGFVCTSSCDVAKAKKGEDPHPLTRAKIAAEKDAAASDPLNAGDPAVVFGGVLAELSQAVQPVDAVLSSGPVNLAPQGSAIDLVV